MKKILLVLLLIYALISLTSINNFNAAFDDIPTMVAVTFYGDAATTRGFNWRTMNNTPGSDVQIIKKNASVITPDFSLAKTYSGTKIQGPVYGGVTGYFHKVAITDLDPGCEYFYRVGDCENNYWSTTGTFKTAGDKQNTLTFLHVSDPQSETSTGYQSYKNTMENAYKLYPNIDFIVNTGDIAENGDRYEQYAWSLEVPKDIMMNTTFAPASGNHDRYENMFNSFYHLPYPSSADTRYGTNYSFDYGNAHFSVLNTNDVTTMGINNAQFEWFKSDLASTNKQWKIVMLHKAIYSTGDKIKVDADIMQTRNKIVPEMMKYGVDLVLQGHDHVYYRTKPLKGIGLGFDSKYEIIEEYIGEEKITYMVEPNGIIYLGSNKSSNGTMYSEIANYQDYGVYPAKSGQPNKRMFNIIEIKNNKLLHHAYTVSPNDTLGGPDITSLYDSFAIVKDQHMSIIDAINNLPSDENLRPSDLSLILDIRSEYYGLAPNKQILVTNIDKLNHAHDIVKDLIRQETLKEFLSPKDNTLLIILLSVILPIIVLGSGGFLLFYYVRRKRGMK